MAGFFGAPSSEVVLTSVFMALEGAFAFSAFLPSIMTIGTFVDSEEKVRMIREGEVVGVAFLGALSLTVAGITKSAWPAILGLAAGLAAICVYEYALRKAPINRDNGSIESDQPSNPFDNDTNSHVYRDVTLYRMEP